MFGNITKEKFSLTDARIVYDSGLSDRATKYISFIIGAVKLANMDLEVTVYNNIEHKIETLTLTSGKIISTYKTEMELVEKTTKYPKKVEYYIQNKIEGGDDE